MVYGIVKQSNGHIQVASEPGRGTTFTIYLPAMEEAIDPNEMPAPPATLALRNVEGGRVLLVEDYEPIRTIAAEVLRSNGYTVVEAQDAGEAINISEQQRQTFDLLLTDVAMPKMSGQELAQRLTSRRPGMPVLYMTGFAEGALLEGPMLPAGAALLEKPFVPDSLVEAVRSALDRRA
jgi:CheY-like chemotaxis protein